MTKLLKGYDGFIACLEKFLTLTTYPLDKRLRIVPTSVQCQNQQRCKPFNFAFIQRPVTWINMKKF